PARMEEEFALSTADEAPAPPPAPSPATRVVPAMPAAAAGAPARPKIEASGPLSDQDREFIDEHLAEGKVFRKYGLTDKAADQFEAVGARLPDNGRARQAAGEGSRA